MKVLGIIAEYNPFHKGHEYHMRQAKALVNPDLTVVVMSGNFVQRGEPAITDKFTRAKMAIDAGADWVIELPFAYATDSAEGFAYGSVKLLDELGIVTDLVFGSELGELQPLEKAADVLVNEPQAYKEALTHHLSTGLSFPSARSKALDDYGISAFSSNDILGVEYVKAIKRLSSTIRPHVIKRSGSNYNDVDLSEGFSSATSIRQSFYTHGINSIRKDLPMTSMAHFETANVFDHASYESALLFYLRTLSIEELASIYGMTEGLEHRLEKGLRESTTLESLIEFLKSKRYTRTKIQRLLVHTLLGLSKEDKQSFDQDILLPRLLAASKAGMKCLQHAKTKVISSPKMIEDLGHKRHSLTRYDIKATDIYTSLTAPKSPVGADYRTKLYIK